MTYNQRDIGARIVTKNAFNPVTLNSSSTAENNVEQTGVTIDRKSTTPGTQLFLSGKVSIPVSYSLGATRTVTFTSNIEHSSASSAGWADATDKDGNATVTKVFGTTSSTAAQTGNDVVEYDVDLGKLKQYVRVMLKANFSQSTTASGSDDADVGGVLILGGSDVTPSALS